MLVTLLPWAKYICNEKKTTVYIINHYKTWDSFLNIQEFNVQLPKTTTCTKKYDHPIFIFVPYSCQLESGQCHMPSLLHGNTA